MTNHDNVGGLVWYVCTSCLLMVQLPSDTPKLGRCQCSPGGWSLRRVKLPKGYELCRAPGDVGGLPELPDPEYPADDEFVDGMKVWPAHPDYYTADQMRAYGELCRAAPAGGVAYHALNRILSVIGADGDIDSRHAAVVDAMEALRGIDGGRYQEGVPAGSGEVEKLIAELEQYSETDYKTDCCNDDYPIAAASRVMRTAAALLRKLQQGADGWRPIESAPKGDRRVVLLVSNNGPNGYITDPWTGWVNSDGSFARWPHRFPPTHWMAISQKYPARAASQGQEGGSHE